MYYPISIPISYPAPPSLSPPPLPEQVCDHKWQDNLFNAGVACKTLGLGSSGVAYITNIDSTLPSSVPIWMVGKAGAALWRIAPTGGVPVQARMSYGLARGHC